MIISKKLKRFLKFKSHSIKFSKRVDGKFELSDREDRSGNLYIFAFRKDFKKLNIQFNTQGKTFNVLQKLLKKNY